MKPSYTTQAQVRDAFWKATYPRFQADRRSRKRQNGYSATVRSAFVEFVEALQKSGEISEKLADRVTL